MAAGWGTFRLSVHLFPLVKAGLMPRKVRLWGLSLFSLDTCNCHAPLEPATCSATARAGTGQKTQAVQLVEGERDVINLQKVEGSMVAAVTSLKHDYTSSITARITPGVWYMSTPHITTPDMCSITGQDHG